IQFILSYLYSSLQTEYKYNFLLKRTEGTWALLSFCFPSHQTILQNPKGRSFERPLGFWKDLTFARPIALVFTAA
ncbi:MAG: hypothetical protein ACLT14_10110, partial [Butyricicoccaceae bacterium]